MRSRWLFFTLFSALAIPGRFMPLFYKSHGQSDSRIGLILASYKIVSFFSTPIFCNAADRWKRREACAGFTYAASSLLFTAQLVALPKLELVADKNRFLVLLLLRTISGILSAPAYPLISAVAIAQLKEIFGENGHQHFGEERLWGAISWAICNFALGVTLDTLRAGVITVYLGQLFCSSLFLVSLLCFLRRNEADQGAKESETVDLMRTNDRESICGLEDADSSFEEDLEIIDEQASMSTTNAYLYIIRQGGISTILFFNMLFWLYAGMSIVESLLFLFFRDELKASNLLCGASVIVTVIFEIPIFAHAPRLLRKLGPSRLAIIGSLAYVVRAFGYSISQNGWFALMLEPLHGVTFGAIHTAAVSFVSEKTPRQLEASAQSLLQVLGALAAVFGTIVGGFVMQSYGSKVLYRGAAVLVLSATFAFGVIKS